MIKVTRLENEDDGSEYYYYVNPSYITGIFPKEVNGKWFSRLTMHDGDVVDVKELADDISSEIFLYGSNLRDPDYRQ